MKKIVSLFSPIIVSGVQIALCDTLLVFWVSLIVDIWSNYMLGNVDAC
jgi:hypothetical protein